MNWKRTWVSARRVILGGRGAAPAARRGGRREGRRRGSGIGDVLPGEVGHLAPLFRDHDEPFGAHGEAAGRAEGRKGGDRRLRREVLPVALLLPPGRQKELPLRRR